LDKTGNFIGKFEALGYVTGGDSGTTKSQKVLYLLDRDTTRGKEFLSELHEHLANGTLSEVGKSSTLIVRNNHCYNLRGRLAKSEIAAQLFRGVRFEHLGDHGKLLHQSHALGVPRGGESVANELQSGLGFSDGTVICQEKISVRDHALAKGTLGVVGTKTGGESKRRRRGAHLGNNAKLARGVRFQPTHKLRELSFKSLTLCLIVLRKLRADHLQEGFNLIDGSIVLEVIFSVGDDRLTERAFRVVFGARDTAKSA
jgi:hypothetical protein